LAPDATPQSATTLRRDEQDSAVGSAPPHYLDALHFAAEHIADPQLVASLDQSGDLLLNGLTGEPGWPTLRGHLLLLAPPAPIRLLNCSPRLPCRRSSMDRCGDRGTCEIPSWMAVSTPAGPTLTA